ncbi:MAG: phosphotransferase, partial [Caulobacteraceae bacterium]
HTPRLRNLLSGVRSLEARADIERALDRFAEFVAPALPDLRAQVIHNDLNPYNVLVGEADFAMIVGLLDFGDMVRAPLVNEVAIAAAYHVSPGADPLAPILEIVGAYNTITPLTAWECDLIFDLIATRLAMTVLITEWRASRYPENSAYIMKNHPAAAAGLKRLGGVSPDQAQDRLRRRCGVEA